MTAVHKEHAIAFRYDERFKVGLSKTCSFKVLALKDYIFFLHKRDEGSLEVYTLSIVCMRPSHLKDPQFWYEIKTDFSVDSREDRHLQLRSNVESCMPKGGFEKSKFSLLVQPEFCLPNGDIHVYVRIKKMQSNDTR